MTRYILITFALLGFAGYEMSGGADFKPRPRPVVEVAEAPAPPVTLNVPTTAATLVATQAIKPRTAAEPAREPLPQVRARLSDGIQIFRASNDAQVRMASLQEIASSASFDAPAQDSAAAPVAPAPVQAEAEVRPALDANADLRSISATRVNLRSGPGIDTEILARLQRGQQVQVLDSDGSGWLRLRTLPGDQVGWIAERLVGPASN